MVIKWKDWWGKDYVTNDTFSYGISKETNGSAPIVDNDTIYTNITRIPKEFDCTVIMLGTNDCEAQSSGDYSMTYTNLKQGLNDIITDIIEKTTDVNFGKIFMAKPPPAQDNIDALPDDKL